MRLRIPMALIACLASAGWTPPGCDEKDADVPVEASGSFEVDKTRIVSPAMGEIASFEIEEGQAVEEGQVVARLDTEDLDLKKEELLAGLETARWQLELVQKGVREEDIKQLKAMRSEVRLQKDLADKKVSKLEKLHADGVVSEDSLDDAQTRRDVAASKLVQINWQLEKARTGAREEEIEIARSAVERIEAGIEQIDKLIEDRTITSPISGTVIDTFFHEGEYCTAGSLLATVTSLDVLDLVVYVSTEDLARVRLGQRAQVTIDAFPERSFEGEVVHIRDEAEFTPSTVQTKQERVKLVFEVEVRVPNPDGYFKPGMPADVVFVEERLR